MTERSVYFYRLDFGECLYIEWMDGKKIICMFYSAKEIRDDGDARFRDTSFSTSTLSAHLPKHSFYREDKE